MDILIKQKTLNFVDNFYQKQYRDPVVGPAPFT